MRPMYLRFMEKAWMDGPQFKTLDAGNAGALARKTRQRLKAIGIREL